MWGKYFNFSLGLINVWTKCIKYNYKNMITNKK